MFFFVGLTPKQSLINQIARTLLLPNAVEELSLIFFADYASWFWWNVPYEEYPWDCVEYDIICFTEHGEPFEQTVINPHEVLTASLRERLRNTERRWCADLDCQWCSQYVYIEGSRDPSEMYIKHCVAEKYEYFV